MRSRPRSRASAPITRSIGLAFLRAAREVDAADERACPRASSVRTRRRRTGRAGRAAGRTAAGTRRAARVASGRAPPRAVRAADRRAAARAGELGRQRAGSMRLSSNGSVNPQTCARSSRPRSTKNSLKPAEQVALRHQHVDRESAGPAPGTAPARGARMPAPGRRAAAPTAGAGRPTLTVTRTPLIGPARPGLLEEARKLFQAAGVDVPIALLRRVPPGRVEEDGLVGEPPVDSCGCRPRRGRPRGPSRSASGKRRPELSERGGLAGAGRRR